MHLEPKALEDPAPHHDVHDPFHVLEGEEDHPLRGPRSLPDQHHPDHRDPSPGAHPLERPAPGDPRPHRLAQQGHRMAAQAEAHRPVVGRDLLAGRGRRQGDRRIRPPVRLVCRREERERPPLDPLDRPPALAPPEIERAERSRGGEGGHRPLSDPGPARYIGRLAVAVAARPHQPPGRLLSEPLHQAQPEAKGEPASPHRRLQG